MLPVLVVYGLVAGFILLIAAITGEAMLGALRQPRRWAWVFCLSVLIGLMVAAPLRSVLSAPDSLPTVRLDGVHAVATPTVTETSAVSLEGLVVFAGRIINAPVASVALLLEHPAADRVSFILAGMWAAASLALLIGLVLTTLRNQRARRSWPLLQVAGAPVRISRDTGPALFGTLRPEIVLPAWLLDRPDAEQRMIVAHERAHLEARDPLVLLLGCIGILLFPWNLFTWWMMRRLRLALEMDCDTRVLRDAASSLPYAQILVATAERRATLRFLSAALADSQSDLERRLNAMTRRTMSHPALRATTAAATSALLILAACEAELPTSAELDAMNAGEMVEAAAPLASVEGATYIVDGVETDAETALLIAPEMIVSVDIRKGATSASGVDGNAVITIHTQSATLQRGTLKASGTTTMTGVDDSFDGLLLIDGKRVDASLLQTIDPEAIESIEVVKGAAAERIYDEPEAGNGVINIRLKATPLMKNR
ncbi:MAG: M56 family metallopeptidase [Longimicrobiales bacterium]